MQFAFAIVLVVICGCVPFEVRADGEVYRSGGHRFQVEEVVGGLNHPWSVAILPDGDFLVSERRGRLWRISDGRKVEITGLPSVAAVGQGGLLDIELARDFAATGRVFFSYSARVERGAYSTAIARAVLRGDQLSGLRTIFVANNSHASGHHFGSRVLQLADGSLVFSIGDRGRRNDAQDGKIHAGSVLRIDANGNAPADNPFIGDGAYLPELYSIGHRNIQGMALASDGSLLAHEHGPQGGDEVNRIIGGRNYGWPRVTYGGEYRTGEKIGVGVSASGYEEPLLQWTPSIAPSGMLIYSGKHFPRWQGNIFAGALAGKHIARLTYDGNKIIDEEKLLDNAFGRIRDIKEDDDGNIYFITDERRGGLYRITKP